MDANGKPRGGHMNKAMMRTCAKCNQSIVGNFYSVWQEPDEVVSYHMGCLPNRSPPPTCSWAEDEAGVWDTACGERFNLEAGTPSDNGMRFCCYCGHALSGEMEDRNAK